MNSISYQFMILLIISGIMLIPIIYNSYNIIKIESNYYE
jgi:hypothetical protein